MKETEMKEAEEIAMRIERIRRKRITTRRIRK
jgi:hypothetical protein